MLKQRRFKYKRSQQIVFYVFLVISLANCFDKWRRPLDWYDLLFLVISILVFLACLRQLFLQFGQVKNGVLTVYDGFWPSHIVLKDIQSVQQNGKIYAVTTPKKTFKINPNSLKDDSKAHLHRLLTAQ